MGIAKRTVQIGLLSWVLLAARGAWCQTELSSWQVLPDAPSWSLKYRAQSDKALVDFGVSSPSANLSPFSNHGDSPSGEAESTPVNLGWQPRLGASWNALSTPEASASIFTKFLYLPLLKRNLDYHSSTGGCLVGRATYAASRIFFTREDSGKGKLNTSYFLAALTAATVQTACRPYWARSSSETFNNFGSTIGSDAGMNVFHEFEPGIRQVVKAHTPKFVSSIEERIAHQNPAR